MNENVLCAIYSAYLDDEFNGIQPLRASDLKCEYEKLGVLRKNIIFLRKSGSILKLTY